MTLVVILLSFQMTSAVKTAITVPISATAPIPVMMSLGKPADEWLADDKFDHFMLSAFIAGMAYGSLYHNLDRTEKQSFLMSGSISLGLGLSKEVYDHTSKKGFPSYKDLIADILGVAVTFFLIESL